jgi:hypothetical protein
MWEQIRTIVSNKSKRFKCIDEVLLGRILSLEANELLAISKGYYKTQ